MADRRSARSRLQYFTTESLWLELRSVREGLAGLHEAEVRLKCTHFRPKSRSSTPDFFGGIGVGRGTGRTREIRPDAGSSAWAAARPGFSAELDGMAKLPCAFRRHVFVVTSLSRRTNSTLLIWSFSAVT